MAVVLVAMGLYGSVYLGWQLRLSDDNATVIKARDLHPKLAIGMTIFFALGALGGVESLIMQGKPIFSRQVLLLQGISAGRRGRHSQALHVKHLCLTDKFTVVQLACDHGLDWAEPPAHPRDAQLVL